MLKIKNLIQVIKEFDNWPSYLFDFWTKKKGILFYKMKNGLKYLLRSNTDDRYIINEIYVHKIYNPDGFEIKKDDIILDIGAHIGIFSIYAANLAKQGKVYSYEPNVNNINLFNKNLSLNSCLNIILENKAVSNKRGLAKFYLSDKNGNTGGHSLCKSQVVGQSILVKTTTLTEIMDKNNIDRINFLKLDCEGAEYDILFNCPNWILNKIDKISMEYHNLDKDNNLKTLINFLVKNNFITKVNMKDNVLYAKNKCRLSIL